MEVGTQEEEEVNQRDVSVEAEEANKAEREASFRYTSSNERASHPPRHDAN